MTTMSEPDDEICVTWPRIAYCSLACLLVATIVYVELAPTPPDIGGVVHTRDLLWIKAKEFTEWLGVPDAAASSQASKKHDSYSGGAADPPSFRRDHHAR